MGLAISSERERDGEEEDACSSSLRCMKMEAGRDATVSLYQDKEKKLKKKKVWRA